MKLADAAAAHVTCHVHIDGEGRGSKERDGGGDELEGMMGVVRGI